jgi:hypothetical protein
MNGIQRIHYVLTNKRFVLEAVNLAFNLARRLGHNAL